MVGEVGTGPPRPSSEAFLASTSDNRRGSCGEWRGVKDDLEHGPGG